MNTGSGQFGRPSMGSWVTYGLGSVCDDLPGFVVLQSGPRGPRGGSVLWGSGMLPSTYQGVPLRNQGDPILNLSTPKDITPKQQRELVEAVRKLNLRRLEETGDDEIATRINAGEMAYRMQSSAPELMDISDESQDTLDEYGIQDVNESTYARNCLLAKAFGRTWRSIRSAFTIPIGITTVVQQKRWKSIFQISAKISTSLARHWSRIFKKRGLLGRNDRDLGR